MRPKLLDLFSCAGGAGMGYHVAGFDVVGVDINPQPRYPFPFHQGDVIDVLNRLLAGDGISFTHKNGAVETLHLWDFAAGHGSPPCQKFSAMSACRPGLSDDYPDLVGPTRDLLDATGLPYVLENVVGAPLRRDLMLCGAMFGRPLYRHRLFESNILLWQPEHPKHVVPGSKAGHWKPGHIISVSGNCSPIALAREAMGIDWTNRRELAESIPPAYTEYIGAQLLAHIESEPAA